MRECDPSQDSLLLAYSFYSIQKLRVHPTKRFAGQKLYNFRAESKESFEMAIAPFLGLIPVAKLALVTIMEVMRLQATAGVVDGIKTASTLIGLGRAIEEEHYAEILRKRPDISERVRDRKSVV